MLIVGVDKGESLDLCQRLSAKTRLATVEEKLLQQTMKDLEVSLSSPLLSSFVMLCFAISFRAPRAVLSCVV